MRILHVLEPADGGVATHVRTLAREQLARGHEVEAVVADRGSLATDLRVLGAAVTTLDLRPELAAPVADARAVSVLRRFLRERRWDVVHTHGNKAGVLARPLAHRLGLPVVHAPHSFAYISQEHRPRRGQAARRALTLGIERALMRSADVLIAVSASERDQALRDGIGTPDRFAVVLNGIDEPPPAAADTRLVEHAAGRPVIGFLARLHEQKAPHAFLDSVADLLASGRPFAAALVGDGPMRAEVERRVAADGLAATVAVLPFAGSPWPALAAFDVYAHPSLWESMPIGLLEAMAASLPIVATDTGGVGEIVAAGETGVLTPVGDRGALTAALAGLLDQPALRDQMGDAARLRRARMFTTAAMADGVDEAYRRARERR